MRPGLWVHRSRQLFPFDVHRPTAALVFLYHIRQGCSYHLGPDFWSSPQKKGLQTSWMKGLHRAPLENLGSCSELSPSTERGGRGEAGQPGEPQTATSHQPHGSFRSCLGLGSWLLPLPKPWSMAPAVEIHAPFSLSEPCGRQGVQGLPQHAGVMQSSRGGR